MSTTSAQATQLRQILEGAVVVSPPENLAVLQQLGIPAKARAMNDLQMRSSSREIPDPLEHWEHPSNLKLKPEGWWLSESASFAGTPCKQNRYKEFSAGPPVGLTDTTAAFCITKDGRLIGIISPNQPDQDSVWVSTTCGHVQATPDNGDKSAPVTIEGHGWKVRLTGVRRLYRSVKTGNAARTGAKIAALALADILILPNGGKRSAEVEGRYETNQTRSFIDTIASNARATAPFEFVPAEGSALGESYRWAKDTDLDGIYRLERNGEPTTATFLVDRELPKEQQLAALDAIDWAPRLVVEWVRKRVEQETVEKPYRPEIPGGRVVQPFGINALGLNVPGQPASHPIPRYLWPSLDGDSPSLDESEEILHEYTCGHVHLSGPVPASQPHSGPEVGTGKTGNARLFITNQRLIAVAPRTADAVQEDRAWWVSHFRHEWIYEVGTESRTKSQVKMLTLKPKPGTETHEAGFYVRISQINTAAHEFKFSGLTDASFLTNTVAAVVAAGQGRTTSEITEKHDFPVVSLQLVKVTRTATRISDPIPYSLPPRLPS